MPPEAAPKTYTEDEHIAVLESRVKNETAALTAERDQLLAEKAELQSQIDVLEAEKSAAVAGQEAAETELANYRREVEEAAELARLRDERAAQVRAVMEHDPNFVTEERANRWAGMEEASFNEVLDALKSTAPSAGAPRGSRETAAFSGGSGSAGTADGKSTTSAFLAARS